MNLEVVFYLNLKENLGFNRSLEVLNKKLILS